MNSFDFYPVKRHLPCAEEQALLEIISVDQHNNSMLDSYQLINDSALLGLREEKKLYIAKQDNIPVAVIIPATAREGYTGDIDLIVGINKDASIAGVRVLSHRETPGLEKKMAVYLTSSPVLLLHHEL